MSRLCLQTAACTVALDQKCCAPAHRPPALAAPAPTALPQAQAVEQAVRASMAAGTTDAVLPGMILNTSKRVSYADPLAGGQHRSLPAGRLECTMQNLADCLAQSFEAPLEGEQGEAAAAGLPTFLVYNQRRKVGLRCSCAGLHGPAAGLALLFAKALAKHAAPHCSPAPLTHPTHPRIQVTSSAKRKLKPGSQHVSQTPDGSFLDLQVGGWVGELVGAAWWTREGSASWATRKRHAGSSDSLPETPPCRAPPLQRNAADMLANHCGVEVPEVRPGGAAGGLA